MTRAARPFLIVVSVLNGVSGLVCGVLFVAAPDGHLLQAGVLLTIIQRLPLASVFFQDFLWIGIAMLLVLGIPNTVASVMLLRRDTQQYRVALAAAVLLLCWTGFELIFMYNGAALGYFIVGLVSGLASLRLMRTTPAAGA